MNGTLTLHAGGVLENPGTIRVTAFVNNGGTIIRNAPIVSAGDLRIQSIDIATAQPGASFDPSPSGAVRHEVMLGWNAEPGRVFTVESSVDMKSWSAVAAVVVEGAPGRYSARTDQVSTATRFFRLSTTE